MLTKLSIRLYRSKAARTVAASRLSLSLAKANEEPFCLAAARTIVGLSLGL